MTKDPNSRMQKRNITPLVLASSTCIIVTLNNKEIQCTVLYYYKSS